jgi:predicted nucleic acid-binding protein
MKERFGLIVTDASPLITLASADALQVLTRINLPILIPDMVYAEVTRDLARLGASGVVDWVRGNPDQVRIAPTNVYAEYEALLSINPETRSKGRGEQAALEVLQAAISASPDLKAFLLFEDKDLSQRQFVRALPDRVTGISTGDLLRELEPAQLIQSADQILDEAAKNGRNIERQRVSARPSEPAASLRSHLERAKSDQGPNRKT